MNSHLNNFRQTIIAANEKLRLITESESVRFPAPGKWSKKQILGHLIDSAANNHQRFVRVQHTDGLVMPRYEQEQWVTSQNYQSVPWLDLLAFWNSYNQHLLHVIANIPTEKLTNTVQIGDGEAVTLGFLIEDYVQHLQQHLAQLLG